MRLLTKAGLGLAILLVSIAIAPAAKADPITITAGGFSLSNLGNNGGGNPGSDSLVGASSFTTTNPAAGIGTFPFAMNLLTFTTGFTGFGSAGSHPFDFSQPITINGLTQTLNISGVIDISQTVDTIHILSSAPLTFNFTTFSVDVNVIPMDIVGAGANGGTFGDVLLGQFTVRMPNCNTVPEPATLSLLGIGLAGIAAKLRQRRKRLRSSTNA